MLSNSDAAKALRTHFKKHLVATLPELAEVLRNPSRSSVYRRLKTLGYLVSAEKPPFLEFEPASAVKFDPDLTGGFRVKWTWSATFGGKRRAGGDFGAHIGDLRKYRAWRAAGSPVRAALAGFPGDVRQLFVAGT